MCGFGAGAGLWVIFTGGELKWDYSRPVYYKVEMWIWCDVIIIAFLYLMMMKWTTYKMGNARSSAAPPNFIALKFWYFSWRLLTSILLILVATVTDNLRKTVCRGIFSHTNYHAGFMLCTSVLWRCDEWVRCCVVILQPYVHGLSTRKILDKHTSSDMAVFADWHQPVRG